MRYDGGVETSVAALTNALTEKGHQVYIASFTNSDENELMSRLDIPENNIIHLGTLKRNYLIKILKLRKIIKLNDFDIIHTHLFHPGLIGRLAAIRLSAASVATEHSTFFNWWRWRHVITDRILAASTDAHIAVSRSAAATLAARTGISPNTIHVVPNAFDASRFIYNTRNINTKKATKNILLIGRLEYSKNIQFAISIVKSLVSRDDTIRLSICGDGSQMEELKLTCEKEGLSRKHVKLLGKISDIHSLMSQNDILLFSSHWEGCPMTIIEAYSSGLPVVATAVPGIVDIVKDKVTGVLIEPGDIEGAVEQIEYTFNNKKFREQLIASALLESAKFHPEIIVEEIIKVYNNAIENRYRKAL